MDSTGSQQQPQPHSRSQGNSVEGVQRLLELSKYDRALALCRELLQSDQDSSELHRLAGVAALAMEDHGTAKLHLDIALQQDPEDCETLFQLSRYWLDKRRLRESESAIRRAIALFPYAPNFWAHLAWVHYQEHDFERARGPAEKALSLAPDDPHVGNVHAVVLAECEDGTKLDIQAQETRLLDILSIDPESHAVQHNTGLFYFKQVGDYEKAVQHFATASALDPTKQSTRELLGEALRHLDPFLKWLYFPYQLAFALKRGARWAASTGWGYLPGGALVALLFLPVLIGLVFWAIAIWPLAKAYEYLTVSELRERMKVSGHPGPLRVHHWPRGVRLLVLAAVYALFWFALVSFWGSTFVKVFLGVAIGIGAMELSDNSLKQTWLQIRDDWRKR